VLGFRVLERREHGGRFHGARIVSGGVTINNGQDDWKLGRDRLKGQGTRTFSITDRNGFKLTFMTRAKP
jgi:hypothetical protein